MKRTGFDPNREPQQYTAGGTTKPEDKPMLCPLCNRQTRWGVLSELGARCGVCYDDCRRQPLESCKAMVARLAAQRAQRETLRVGLARPPFYAEDFEEPRQ